MDKLFSYSPFSVLDFLAFLWFLASWIGYAWASRYFSNLGGRNLVSLTSDYRLAWMRMVMRRDNRMADISAVGHLQRSITFFANTSIFLELGLFTMLGYRDKAQEILGAFPIMMSHTEQMWEIKIFLLMWIFVYTFFKFTWSLRQYNYAAIYINAMPFSYDQVEHHELYARRGALLITNAARHFNYGMRGYYFGLAAFSWLIHTYLFVAVTTLVLWVLYRREFFSQTYSILSDQEHLIAEKGDGPCVR